MQQVILKEFKKPGIKEAAIWLAALGYFALSTPQLEQHLTVCAFNWLGFTHCLGCGIGRSIGFFMHGDVASSWQMHYLGIPVTLFLLYRSGFIIFNNYIKTTKPNYHE
jgi:hypothetical protein